jgi:hypothetical protein
MSQLQIPQPINLDEVARKPSLGKAIDMCAEIGGARNDAEVSTDLKVDKAQLSRWKNDSEGIKWPKLKAMMEAYGNHAPVLWMLHDLGYDLTSLRMRETETERKLREAEGRIAELEARHEIEIELLRKIKVGA